MEALRGLKLWRFARLHGPAARGERAVLALAAAAIGGSSVLRALSGPRGDGANRRFRQGAHAEKPARPAQGADCGQGARIGVRRIGGRARRDRPGSLARDAAVLALLYGAGLRISEALSIRRAEAPVGTIDSLTILGKGGKTRAVPVIVPLRKGVETYLELCPFALAADGPLFVGARGGPLVAAHHSIDRRTTSRRLGIARFRHAARLAPFLRQPSAGTGRRPALDPGIARSRQPVHHANLYSDRQGAVVRGLSRPRIRRA